MESFLKPKGSLITFFPWTIVVNSFDKYMSQEAHAFSLSKSHRQDPPRFALYDLVTAVMCQPAREMWLLGIEMNYHCKIHASLKTY